MKALAACLILVFLAGCASKEKPAPPEAAPSAFNPPRTMEEAQARAIAQGHFQPAPQPKPKVPFSLRVVSWIGSVTKYLPKLPKKEKPPAGIPPRLVGTIKMVDKDQQFVLIDALGMQDLKNGDLFVTIMNQRQTSNLRMSALRNPPFIIADIASGNPAPGDRVFKP